MDDSVADVIEEVVEPQTEQVSPEQQQQSQESEKNDREYNFSRLREKAEAAERKAAELERKMMEFTRSNVPVEEVDDLSSISNDEWLTKEQSMKLAKKMAKEAVHEALKQKEAQDIPTRILNKYPDFESVVTVENVELLKQTEPELAQALSATVDPFAQAVAAYKYIKKFVPNAETQEMDKNKAKKNMTKPGSPSQVSSASGIQAANSFAQGRISKEAKDKLWKEILDSKRTR